MRIRHLIFGFTAFLLAITGATADAAVIGPGSGVATVAPATAVVAQQGTWSILYSAEDNFTNGTIRITIPAGWTAPQDTDPTAPGYVTVSSDHGAALPTLAIAGQVVTISVVDLPKKSVTLVYGDDSGGAQPGARAVPPTTAASGVEFAVESDPTGTFPVPLLLGPATLDLVGGEITELVFANGAYSFNTATYGGPYTVQARDTYGNVSASPSDQQINLVTDSPQGSFSPSSSGSPSVGNLTMPVGAGSVTFYYRDTHPGTPWITAEADGQSWIVAAQQQQVAAGPPDHFGLTPQDATVTAGDFMTFKIRVEDIADNLTPLTQNRTLLLSSSVTAAGPQPASEQGSGEFFLPSNHSTPITEMSMSAGEESVFVDYRNTDANGGSPHLVIVLSNNASPTLSGNTNVYVEAAGVSASVSSVAGPASPITADGADEALITVTVTDSYGNPINGASVVLAASGSAVVTDPSGTTGADGVWQTTTGITNTVAETVTVTATVNGSVVLDMEPQIVFEAGPVDHYDVVESTNSTTAGTLFNVTITALDVNDNRVMDANNSVDLVAVDPLNTSIVLPDPLLIPSAFLSAGQVIMSESYDVARDIVIRARDASSNEGFSGTITINPAAAKRVTNVSGNPTGVTPGGTVVLRALVTDAYGNGVSGETVVFSATGDKGSILPPASVPSDANGEATASFTTDTVAGVNGAQALIDDGNPPGDEIATFMVTTSPSGVDHYGITLAKTNLMADESMSITVQAYDEFNNPITDDNTTSIVLTTDTGHGFFNGSPEPLTGTLLNGTLTRTFKDQTAENVRIEVETNGDPSVNGTSALITVAPGPGYKVEKITADVTGVGVGAVVRLEARVFDQWDNALGSYAPVVFSVDQDPGGDATLSDGVVSGVKSRNVTTDATGLAWIDLTTSTTVGQNTVDVEILDGATPERTKTFSVTTESGAIAYYTVTPQKTNLVADESITITVQAYDGSDNPITDDNTTSVVLTTDTGHGFFNGSPEPLTGTLLNGTLTRTFKDQTAENVRIEVETNGNPGVNGTSALITVTTGPAYKVEKITADQTDVGVGATVKLEARVFDQWNNAIGSYSPVVFAVDQDPGGDATLSDGVVSGVKSRNVTTDGTGLAWIDLTTSATVGQNTVDVEILDGATPDRTKTFSVTTVAGAIAKYEVIPDVTTETAGTAFGFTVRALDSENNLVTSATNFVDLSVLPGGATTGFEENPVQLSSGVKATTLTWTTAGDIQIRAETQGGGATGTSDPITIVPGLPAGPIGVETEPDTITANGVSTTTILSDPIRDSHGNPVATGTLITVSTNRGTITSDDVDPADGIQRATGANGKISITLRSSIETTFRTVTVTMEALANPAATGTATEYFAPRPTIVCNSPPVPAIVSPGDTKAFEVDVQNTSITDVKLLAGTTFRFSDGAHPYEATLASDTWVLDGATRTLVFSAVKIDDNMQAGPYTPLIDLAGQDQYGSPFDEPNVSLPLNSLRVTAIQITAISADSPVSRGHDGVVRVFVDNKGPVQAEIQSVTLTFSNGNQFYSYNPSLSPPVTIAGLGSAEIPMTVGVLSTTTAGTYTIDAAVAGIVGVDEVPVSDPSVSPFPLGQWTIERAAEIGYINDTLDPDSVTIDEIYGFSLGLANTGQATVTLDDLQSWITFNDGAGHTYTAGLSSDVAIAGGTQQTVQFNDVQVPISFNAGTYAIDIQLVGSEGSGDFNDLISTSDQNDSVTVVTPSSITYAGSLDPSTVSRQTAVSFSFVAENVGGADLVLIPDSTRFWFDNKTFNAALTSETTIRGNDTATLRFRSTLVTSDPAQSPYTPRVRVVGIENGYKRDFMLTAQPVNVLAATTIAITSTTPSQDQITQNQSNPITVKLEVQNNGGAAVRLDSTRIRFFRSGVEVPNGFTITPPTEFDGGPTLAGGGAIDSVTFDVTNNGPPAGNYTIEGFVYVTNLVNQNPIEANTSTGGKGSLLVQLPGVLEIVDISPSQQTVTQGQGNVEIWMKVRNSGEAPLDLRLPGTASLDFTPAGSWMVVARDTLDEGGVTLESNDEGTVVFDVVSTGGAGITYRINGSVTAEDANSPTDTQTAVSDAGSEGSVTVTAPAVVSLSVDAPEFATTGYSTGWEVLIGVTNSGGTGVQIDFSSPQTRVEFVGSIDFEVQKPVGLEGGGDTVLPSQTRQMKFVVNQTGSPVGPTDVKSVVVFDDVNSAVSDSSDTTAAEAVLIQNRPSIGYIDQSIDPDAVSRGQTATFALAVENLPVVPATLILDPTQTRLRFGEGYLYNVTLDPLSDRTINGGGSTPLSFNSQVVDTNITAGTYTPQLILVGTENGNSYGPQTIDLVNALTVEDPSALEVQDVSANVSTVTRGQSDDWTISLFVKNNGQATVDLDLLTTRVRLVQVGGGDRTSEYVIVPPTKLVEFPDKRLPGNSTGTLEFTVDSTGTTTGTMVLRGHVEGIDENSLLRVTGDGVGGSVIVQEPAGIAINDVTVIKETVTEDQSGWTVTMKVENTGDAALDLDLTGGTLLEFGPTNTGWSYDPPTLQGGGNELSGGATGTIEFNMTGTGPAGLYTVGGRVSATESNRPGVVVTDTTDTTREDSVRVQTPGAIRITGITKLQEPVTQGQETPWNIDVDVINDGQAEVRLNDDPDTSYIEFINGDSAPFPYTSGTLSLPGGQSTTLRFEISPQTPNFGDEYGYQPFTVRVGGIELNRDEAVFPALSDDSVAVELRPDPTYIEGSLLPKNANAGEPASFRIRVREDSGRATLVLDPDRTKLWFTSGATTIQPRLDATKVSSILAGGDTTLFFEQVPIPGLPNPFPEGSYQVTVELVGEENGNPYPPYPASFTLDPDSVTIGAQSGVEIVHMTASQETVTAGQGRDWQVWMTVKNDGAATLLLNRDLTKLALSVSGVGVVTDEYTIDPPSAFEVSNDDSLREGATDSLMFNVSSTGDSWGPLRIDGTFFGKDVDADKDISDNTNNAGWIDMLVQTPADLSVAASITFPPNADTLSTDQQFTLTALVTNNGQSSVDNSGELALGLPSEFMADSSLTRSFTPGSVVQWDIKAPPDTASNQTLTVSISRKSIEGNSGRLAAVTDSVSTLVLQIVERAGFTPLVFDATYPEGATDSVVSTDQRYHITARTIAEATTTGITATLQILSGTVGEVIENLTRPLGNGDGGEKSVTWRIDAPDTPGEVQFRVRYDGRDENSGKDIFAFSDTLTITTVEKPRLELSAAIERPEEAKDGQVAFGTIFEIDAVVDNLGTAGIDTTGARISITIPGGSGYEFVSTPAKQSFAIGETVTWRIQAPNAVTGIVQMPVAIAVIPNDENTNAPVPAANVDPPIVISVQTQTNAVTVDDISQDRGIDTKVVPKGTSGIHMLAIEVANPDPSAEAVRIDSFRVTLFDGEGRAVTNPSATVSEFYALWNETTIPGVVTQNPMVIDAGGIVLPQGGDETFIFAVSIARNAKLEEIVISFHGPNAIAVKEVDSGQPILVVDRDNGEAINGRIKSQPLVILSNNFEEYAHNYPNPFRAGSEMTKIAYIMEKDASVSVKIFDLTGSLVYEKHYGVGDTGTRAGPQEVTWDGRNMNGEVVRNGLYICQLDAGGRSTRIRIAVAK